MVISILNMKWRDGSVLELKSKDANRSDKLREEMKDWDRTHLRPFHRLNLPMVYLIMLTLRTGLAILERLENKDE